ncbi:indole-3-glycerol phosphate synthase TrpC [Segatella oris]|uniref:indole-3-glycerol phosphate synthase TrpC n=1 Tax=Segatella oris TaxID=28135 RepID=UPI0028E434FB|nr:indole-3-glycerol phosphate synthase TrpC [Segatella oris]
MNILEEIIAHKHMETDQRKQFVSPRQLYALVAQKIDEEEKNGLLPNSFRAALQASKIGVVAEFKRKSPGKGWINEHAKASTVPLDYEKNGATALSILTDIDYFAGYDEFVQEARAVGVSLPILYSNFIVDDYQLLQARFCGASAVLLIAECLSKDECRRLLALAHQLGLEVMLTVHNECSLDYAALEPDVLSVSNRDLSTWTTDVETSFRLAEKLPREACKVSGGGICDAETANRLHAVGYQGVLIGECLMRQNDPGLALKAFVHELKPHAI